METTDLTGCEEVCRRSAGLHLLSLQIVIASLIVGVWALCMGIV